MGGKGGKDGRPSVTRQGPGEAVPETHPTGPDRARARAHAGSHRRRARQSRWLRSAHTPETRRRPGGPGFPPGAPPRGRDPPAHHGRQRARPPVQLSTRPHGRPSHGTPARRACPDSPTPGRTREAAGQRDGTGGPGGSAAARRGTGPHARGDEGPAGAGRARDLRREPRSETPRSTRSGQRENHAGPQHRPQGAAPRRP